MATSSAMNTSNQYIKYTISVTEKTRSATNIADNETPVTVSVRFYRTNTGYETYGSGTVYCKIDGTKYSASVDSSDKITNSGIILFTKDLKIKHDSDGTKKLTCSAWITHSQVTSSEQSYTQTLSTIYRVSEPTVSKDSVVMLNKVTINTNRKSSSFTHELTYKFNGYEGKIATNAGASYEWTVPDLVSKISGKSSGTCTIYCKTKSGTTVIGTKSVKLTLTIPAKSTPSASIGTVQMGDKVDIYTNRKSTAYTHTLTYEMGDASGTIDTDVEGGRTWTVPKSLVEYTEKQTSGICTITCKTYNGTLLVGTATSQIILVVPSATVPTLSATSIVLGDPITIYTPRAVDCYEHDISYALKAKGSSTVAFTKEFSGAVQESYEWTPSLKTLAYAIPTATEGTIIITCTTRFKESETVIGEADASFDIRIPDNETTKPKLNMVLTPVHSLASAFNDVYVQGKSKVKISYEVSSEYSHIDYCETEILGVKSKTIPYESKTLSNAGTVTIVGRVTDKRGYSSEKTVDIEVIPYSKPRITPGENKNSILCIRGNSNGMADPGGVYLLINIGRKYSKVTSNSSQKNFCKLSYQWKTDAQGDDEYSNPTTLLEKTATSDYVAVTLKDIVSSNTIAYNIKLIAEDDIGEDDTVIATVPTAFATYHAPIGGHGFTLGGFHDPSKIDVFDCRFDAEFQGDVSGRVFGLGALPSIPENADLNDYKDFGVYAIGKNAAAKTLVNCPSEKAGTLRVWSSNGNGKTTGDYVYIMQEYISYDNSATYRRSIQLPNPESAWEYGEWTLIANYSQGLTDGWYWRKYVDGTAECWRRVKNAARDVNTQFGSMYYANCDEVTFPFNFHSAPIVNATVESGTALTLLSWQGSDGNGTTTASKPASYRVMRPTTITGASFTIAYHAIGRWKE